MSSAKLPVLFLCVVQCVAGLALAAVDEPDGLRLPPGFHAAVVADALGPIRHLAVGDNGNIYVSTPREQQGNGKGAGIIALHLSAAHTADQVQHFGSVDGGTGIRFSNGALYASTDSAVYRFTFNGDELVPAKQPDIILDGMPASHPGFNRTNRPIALDGNGNLFVALDGSGNLCTQAQTPPGGPAETAAPVALNPCPDLGKRSGIWRFSSTKTGQRFPADGVQLATGIRDMTSLDWSPIDGNLYGIMHGRDNSRRFWPDIFSAEDEDHVADEMHRVTKGTDFGWPYTYYDGARNLRLVAPEYGGDGKKSPPAGKYSTPIQTFHSRRSAPVDLQFYNGKQFPAQYRGGAFIVLHGTGNRTGYDVVFVPFDRKGKAGAPTVFADGFAAFDSSKPNPGPAKYRPVGAAVGPDGSLYLADSQKGRVWRISYDGPAR
jgi:glucose/arabinose dehydrogenase